VFDIEYNQICVNHKISDDTSKKRTLIAY